MYDLVVLGGGSGALSVAKASARVGARVALVVSDMPEGRCTHSPSVPIQALSMSARLAQQIRQAPTFGLSAGSPDVAVDFPAVMARVRAVAAELAADASDDALRALGIEVFHGTPEFEAYDTVVVDGKTRLNAQRFVIATGSRPAIPAVPGLADAGYLDSDSICDLDTLPGELVILGAGSTAVELAQAYARLGSKVTVLSEPGRILPGEDPEVSQLVKALLEAEGIAFWTNAELTRVDARDGRKVCTVKDKATGATNELSATHLLIAAGRLANIHGLNLDAAGIHVDPEHGIEVDDYQQTRSTRIMAIGDVLPDRQSPGVAEREAAVAFQNAVLRIPRKMDRSAPPRATFIDPEVATVGLTEADARDKHPEVLVFRSDLTAALGARIDGRQAGCAKLVVTPSGKILGATIVGPEASLVLQEFVLAMEHGLTLKDIAETVHIEPTYAGLSFRLANDYLATRLDSGFLHKAIRWFYGYQPRPGDPSVLEPEHHEPPVSAGHANGHGH